MYEQRDIQALKDTIASESLEEGCKVVISEIRSGVFRAQHGLKLLHMVLDVEQLTVEQQQFLQLTQEGVDEAIEAVEVLLVDSLLARLRSGSKL